MKGHINHTFYYLIISISLVDTAKIKESNSANGEELSTMHPKPAIPESTEFLKRLFHKYGGSNHSMTYEAFEHLLVSLGLGNLAFSDHDLRSHFSDDVIDSTQTIQTGFRRIHNGHDHWPVNEDVSQNDRNTEKEHMRQNFGAMLDEVQSTETSRNRRTSHQHKSEAYEMCLRPQDFLLSISLEEPLDIDERHFLHVCPVIIYQLDVHACQLNNEKKTNKRGLRNKSRFSITSDEKENSTNALKTKQKVTGKTWLWATIAVSIISIVGFLCVGIIPLMQSLQETVFKRMLHFLVAMAIGTLTGDALLHLIPHAMVPHVADTHEHDEQQSEGSSHNHSVYIGLVVLLGIFSFFFLERTVQMVGQCRKTSKSARHYTVSGARRSSDVGAKLSESEYTEELITLMAKSSETPQINYHQFVPSTNKHPLFDCTQRRSDNYNNERIEGNEPHSTQHIDYICTGVLDMYNVSHKGNQGLACTDNELTNLPSVNVIKDGGEQEFVTASSVLLHKNENMYCGVKQTFTPNDQHTLSITGMPNECVQETNTELHRCAKFEQSHSSLHADFLIKHNNDPSNQYNGHSHSVHGNHGHRHALPGNGLSSVVWMVILGDGVHNFCDGLAIGAAFASGLSSGFSTSVAVFFHELPHEIGDFAVLLSAGMPTKQALFYNVVSSVLCFIGLCIGILLGNFSSASHYIFAMTAGMFIYISLADMLPELNTKHPDENKGNLSLEMFLQYLGIACGLGVMLTIALYEDVLTEFLESF